jgi:hypothetical protein
MALPRLRTAVPAAALALLVSACTHAAASPPSAATPPPAATPPGASTPPAAVTLDGTWTGSWARTAPVSGGGQLTLVLHQQGGALSGTIDTTGGVCLAKGTLTGTVNGPKVTFHGVFPSATGDFTGSVTGGTMTGTLSATCSEGTGTGTWQAVRS